MTTGPIRYLNDRGISTYFTWFDQRVEWADMIGFFGLVLIGLIIWDVWRKRKEV